MLDFIKIIVLGIVEGITEWLPISSTGHLLLLEHFMKVGLRPEFLEMFRVVIQLGAIMAVVVLYFHKLNPFSPSKNAAQKRNTYTLWSKVLVASIPAAILGLLLDDFLDEHLYKYWVVGFMLILYGVLFIVVERYNEGREPVVNKLTDISYQLALCIGVFQVLALIPGTSRSGATIVGALLLGVSRHIAAEFTFYLAIPVMFGASFLKLVKFGFSYSFIEVVYLLVGCVVAYFVSVVAIKLLMKFIKNNDFKVFGYYRIVLGLVVLVVFFLQN